MGRLQAIAEGISRVGAIVGGALLLLVRSLHALLTGDLAKVFELIGSKSAVAEAEEEVRATERAMDDGRRP